MACKKSNSCEKREYKSISVDGCEIIGQGARGTVYRYDDTTAVKVYNRHYSLFDILKERDFAKRAFDLKIPTAMSYDVVKVGESYGAVFELLDATTYSRLIADNIDNADAYIGEYAELLKKIHTTTVDSSDVPDIKIFANEWIDTISDYIEPAQTVKIKSLISKIPDTKNMLHCDYHTNNVMRQNGEAILVDMDTLSRGHPVFEFANMYVAYVGLGKEAVEGFLGIPKEVADYIWDKTLRLYFDTDDAEFLKQTENKAKVIAYLRMFRYYIVKGNGCLAKNTARCLTELLPFVDTLDF